MNDFTYYNPTKIEFGKNKEENIGQYIKEADISKVLLVYGMGSIKSNGLYEKIIASLEKNNIAYEELDGIVSNPLLSRVYDGVKIAKEQKVEAILVNIFGGIVRCDRVAQGVVDAYKNIGDINVPIIVRLQGTNAIEAKKLIDDSGLKVHSAVLLKEAAQKVKEVLA